MCGLSLAAASGGHSSSQCAGLSLSRSLLLRSTGSRRAGSVVVAHGPSCSAACGIFTDQGSNPCPLHWQADSQPLRHQGSLPLFLKHNAIAHLCTGKSKNWWFTLLQYLLWRGCLDPYRQYLRGLPVQSSIGPCNFKKAGSKPTTELAEQDRWRDKNFPYLDYSKVFLWKTRQIKAKDKTTDKEM